MHKLLYASRHSTIQLVLIVATLASYWQVRNHGFLNYDDQSYVTENFHVQAGLSWEGIIWAFTTTHASNWHPLTWLSHMCDCELYDLRPAGHHMTSVLFHLGNTLLLFYVLRRMTGALWRSAFVAALFALHPLHVESVAWVAERKDVLSTFFWFTTMWTYVRYVQRPGFATYLLTVVSYTLGLMAKPMLVTLPFVLLLLDYWPLRRFQLGSGEPKPQKWESLGHQTWRALHLVWEKTPLFALSAVSSGVTFLAQQSGGAISSPDLLPINIRMANALTSYVSYMGKMIWPHHLAVFYPHPGKLPIGQALAAGLLLLCISVLVIRMARRSPYLAVGWLWYVGTLVPVIGIVQVGNQSMADRYTYVPLIGLFIITAWGVAELAAKWRYRRLVLATSAGVVLVALTACTWLQIPHWHNSVLLFEHALDVTRDNYLAHYNLGHALLKKGRLEEAMAHFFEVVKINPSLADAHHNLGLALTQKGKLDQAISHYSEALRIDPNRANTHNDLGIALVRQKKLHEAIAHFSEALKLRPDNMEVRQNLKRALEIAQTPAMEDS